jgi:DNA polymerase-3 subunit epsilon
MSESVIAIIDVETTGVNPERDRVIEFAVQKGLDPDFQKVWRVNPGIPIHPAATAVHGITDDDVKDEPQFAALIPVIKKILAGCEVIVGYNVEFDIRCIEQEFLRNGEKKPGFDKKIIVDPLKIWRHFEPRKLEDAVKRFVGGKHETAHTAAGDVEATGKVLQGMLKTFGVSQLSWKELQNVMEPGRENWVGPSSHFKWENDEVTINFGKNRGKSFYQISQEEADYLAWLKKSDFPEHIKELIEAVQGKSKQEFINYAEVKFGRIS